MASSNRDKNIEIARGPNNELKGLETYIGIIGTGYILIEPIDPKIADIETPIYLVRTFRCNKCDVAFLSEDLLIQHMSNHTNEKQYLCCICGQAILSKQNFKLHLMWHRHQELSNFMRNTIIKAEVTKNDAQANLHEYLIEEKIEEKVKSKYMEKRPTLEFNEPDHLRCSKCDVPFLSINSLKQHMKKHNIDKQYKCNQCGKAYVLKRSFEMHIAAHNIEKQYKCNQCGKVYVSKRFYELHMVAHSREKPYQCKLQNCEEVFSRDLGQKYHADIQTCIKSFQSKNIYNWTVPEKVPKGLEYMGKDEINNYIEPKIEIKEEVDSEIDNNSDMEDTEMERKFEIKYF